MGEVSTEEAKCLATMIYAPQIDVAWSEIRKEKGESCTLAQLVERLETNLDRNAELDNYGAEMSKEQFWGNIDQIKQSETLMSLEVEDVTDNKSTYFRAITLVDPNNPSASEPKIIFRGTAGNYQWDDNFSVLYSSLTPSQQEAVLRKEKKKKPVINWDSEQKPSGETRRFITTITMSS